jgi:hypothetical protein
LIEADASIGYAANAAFSRSLELRRPRQNRKPVVFVLLSLCPL